MLNTSYFISNRPGYPAPTAARSMRFSQNEQIPPELKAKIPELDELIQRYQQTEPLPSELNQALASYRETLHNTQPLFNALLNVYKNDRSLLPEMRGNLIQSLLHLANTHETDREGLLLQLIEEGIATSGKASSLAMNAELLLNGEALVLQTPSVKGQGKKGKAKKDGTKTRPKGETSTTEADDARLQAAIEAAKEAGLKKLRASSPNIFSIKPIPEC